jgi:hypothetical protein
MGLRSIELWTWRIGGVSLALLDASYLGNGWYSRPARFCQPDTGENPRQQGRYVWTTKNGWRNFCKANFQKTVAKKDFAVKSAMYL